MTAVALAAPVVDEVAVRRFADQIMCMIGEDVAEGAVPWSVADFGELHTFCDANMYYEYAGQVYDGSRASIDEIAAVGDEVTRRIRDGALVAALLAGYDDWVRDMLDLYGSWERYLNTLRVLYP